MARLTDKSVPKGLLSSPTDSSGRSADAAGCAPHGAILTLVALMARIAARETIAVMDAGEDSTLEAGTNSVDIAKTKSNLDESADK